MSDEQKTSNDNNDEVKLEQQIEQWMDGKPEDASEASSAPELATSEPNEATSPAEPATNEATSITSNPSQLDDETTGAAIDEINRNDSDAVLAAEDDKASAPSQPPKKPNFFKRWWASKPWRYGTLVLLLVVIIAVFVLPTSRWWIFNQLGVRSNVAVTVLDASTNLPLKDASVSLAGQTKTTTKDGQASFANIRLGQQELTINKPAFASTNRNFTVKLGANNLGKLALKAVGIQYRLKLTDYLTGQPVDGAEVTSGKASALSNASGQAVLTLMSQQNSLAVKIGASGYNPVASDVNFASGAASINLVPSGKNYFFSKASGDYSAYSSNLDGSAKKVVLKASGKENGDLQLAADDGGDLLAALSVRDDQRDASGYRLQALTIVNTANGNTLTLDHAKQISLIGWFDGSTLVYVSQKACGVGICYRLVSYNYQTGNRQELVQTSNLTGVVTIGDRIYYANSDNSKPEFVAINADGTNKQVLLKEQVYSIYRSSYDKLQLAALGNWYGYQAGDKQASKIKPPSSPELRHYVDSPDGKNSAWIDQRDGQPVLLIHNQASGQDKEVASVSGLTYPIRWLDNNTLIFRVNDDSQTADYALNLSGGKPQKIVDVTNASGADDLHY